MNPSDDSTAAPHRHTQKLYVCVSVIVQHDMIHPKELAHKHIRSSQMIRTKTHATCDKLVPKRKKNPNFKNSLRTVLLAASLSHVLYFARTLLMTENKCMYVCLWSECNVHCAYNGRTRRQRTTCQH